MAAVVEVEFLAKLEQAIKDINSVEGITADSANAAAKAWIAAEQRKTKATEAEHRKRIKQIEDEAKKAEEAAKSTTEKVAAEANKLGKIGSVIGGPIGGAIALIADGSEIASDGLGDAAKSALKFAVGVGIVAAAATVTIGAIYKLGSAAIQSVRAFEDTVEVLGEHDTVVQRNQIAIREAATALEMMDAAESRLGVTLTGMVSPAIEEAGYAIVGLVEGLNSGIQVAMDLNAGVASLSGGVSALEIGLGLAAANAVMLFPPLAALVPVFDMVGQGMSFIAGQGREASEEMQKLNKTAEDNAKWMSELQKFMDGQDQEAKRKAEAKAAKALADAERSAASAKQKREQAAIKAEQEKATAATNAAAMVQDAQRSVMSGEDQLLAKQADRLTKFEELAEAGKLSDIERASGLSAILKQNEQELYDFKEQLRQKEAADQDKAAKAKEAADNAEFDRQKAIADILFSLGRDADRANEDHMTKKARRAAEFAQLQEDHAIEEADTMAALASQRASAAEIDTAIFDLHVAQEKELRDMRFANFQEDVADAAEKLQLASDVVAGISDLQNVLFENKTKSMDKESAAYRKAAKKQFAIQKAFAITMAVVNTAAAVMNALATAPTIIAGIALAAVAGVTGAVQIGLIAAQQPKFHTGGLVGSQSFQPDEMGVTAQRGEGFLTRTGVAAVGGEAGIDGLNSGRAPSSNTTTMAIVNIDGRTLDSMWTGTRKGKSGLRSRIDDQIRGQGLKGRSATRGR